MYSSITNMEFINAGSENFDDYYMLRCDPNNIYWSGHASAPGYDNLKGWYLKNINLPGRNFFLAYNDKAIAGYLYIDKVQDHEGLYDTGYGVLQSMNGKGVGTQIIAFAIDYVRRHFLNGSEIQGWVASDNIGSQRVFIKNLFSKTTDTKEVRFAGKEEPLIFERFSLALH